MGRKSAEGIAEGTETTINVPGSPLHGAKVKLGKEIGPGYFGAEVLDGPCKGDKLGVSLDQCS